MHHRWTRGGNPSIWSFTQFKRPRCRSEIIQTCLEGPSTLSRTSLINHDQLSLFSLSANANATGTSWPSGSTATAIISVPLYLPVKNVPSTGITGRQMLECNCALWEAPKDPLQHMLVNPILADHQPSREREPLNSRVVMGHSTKYPRYHAV